MRSPFDAPVSASRAGKKIDVASTNLAQVGSALPADGVRPVARFNHTENG